MGDNSNHLTSYKQFFSRFSSSVDPSDQLPVKVAGYNLTEFEIVGAVTDWCLQYLNQRQCPSSLVAPLIQMVVKEVRLACSIDPKAYQSKENDFLPLQLMHLTMRKLVEVCCQYSDSTMLSTLPPPYTGLSAPKVSSCAIRNSRRSMEDRHIVLQDLHVLFNIKDHGPASYYAVFDGHNGLDAAVYGVSHLHQFLAESQYYPEDPVRAFKDAFQKTDEQFFYKSAKENLRSGTTAVCALLRPKESMLYIAWLGDSQAVIVKQGYPTQIVKPHKPDREDERERIEGMGGSVLFWGTWRVNGQLAVSRAIGDLEYKPYVSAEADVKTIPLDGTEDFLILACDGLWDFVSEQEAVNAVYNQLSTSPDDLEGVSQRLVGLSKDQGSADNISVVVVFLAEPSEVARQHHMETASPNPFLKQNGSELFCGASANGKLHPCPSSLHDEDDFGPETDVDMVDDVLLSPAIAAAKKLVAEKRDFEDDLERQRHQMSDFDDPADVDRSRDTPTPPAHEVVGNVDENIAAESGEGEESEEEWNYFCGSTQNNKDTSVNTESQDSDMTSQLNPNAAEFVPVSPSRFMMDPDPVISSSPMRGHEKSLDNVPLPSQVEFNLDIAHRPGQLDSSGIESHMWSGGITGSDDTQLVKSEPMSTNAEDGDSHVLAFEVSTNNPTEEVFGKVLGDVTHNELDSFNNKSTKYASTFGSENSDSFKDLETYSSNAVDFHPSVKVDSDLKDYCVPQEPDDSIATGTQKSTALEAPVSPCDMQTDIDSPDDNQHNQKSPELISPSDGHLEGFSVQEPTSSSGFESESGADEPETHISDDLKHSEGEGFTIEHRKSPPVQPVYFKPIHTFSDTNPFGILDNLTSPNTEKESSLIETDNLKTDTTSDFKMVDCSVDNKSDLLGDILQEVPAYIQNSKADCNALNENLLSALPIKQHTSDERDEQTLISILNESQGTDECKQIEKIIPKNDDVLTATRSVFSSDTDETEHINPVFSKSACIYESKIEELETLEFKESKIIAGIEPLEMESEMKSKGNVSNAVTGLEFETSKQEFDDKVSDIIFGSKDTELAFDSGKSCEIEAVSNSSEHQAHNFEEIQFDTSKSNNKLESKYFDIHFGTDDIEFETESNDYNHTNKSEEKSVPCKEETENTIIEEENKLAGNVINDNIESVELSVNNISSECSNLIQNIEIAESIVDQDSVIQSSKEYIETSVSSATEELLNQSENLITELCEDQIAISKVTAAYDFGKDLPDLFHTVQDVQGKKDEGNEARELDEEIHNNIVLVGAEKEISNTIEIEMCSGFVKEVGAESIPVMQPELTEFPLSTRVADKIGAASKMEELASCKTETSNCVNLNVIKDISALETAVNTREELVQAVIPETENELIPQALQNEESVTGDELSELVQNKSSVLEDNEIKANKEGIEVVTNLIPTSKIDSVYKEYNQDSGFCKSAATEMQDLSKHVQSESQVQKSFQFEDTTSTVSEVVIPTLNETCVMPVTELELPQVSNDKVLKPVNETQLELYSDNVEQTPQTEETGEIPSVTETPPPTPAPGIVEEKGDKKEGLLAAAAAAAGVATAAAVVASDSKQASKKLATTTKKTVPVVSKKSLDTGSKTGAKPSLKTAGSPSRPVASKPPPQTTVTKKPSTTGVSKTTKPVASDIKTTPTATKSVTSKPSTPTSRTATTTSKPSTPHSKPATPTSRPVSANKGDISKSTLAKPTPPAKITAAKPSKPATNTVKVTDKKTLTNGDVSKPGAKKTEHSETKKLPPSASKSVATVGRPASVVAAKSPVTKTSVTAKTAVVSKTSTIAPAVQNKPKPAVSNLIKQTTKPSTPSKSQPLSVSTTLKPTDKTGKDTVNKQISSVKASTVNKVSPGNKTTLKTESRVSNTVDSSKLKSKDQVKKPMGTKKQEPTQEHIVTTTNGYTEIIETGVKKEPSVDNSNQEVVKALE